MLTLGLVFSRRSDETSRVVFAVDEDLSPRIRCECFAFELIDLFRGFELADRKSTRLNSSHGYISYAVFCLKKKK